MRLFIPLVWIFSFLVTAQLVAAETAADTKPETAADTATRSLLDALEDKTMPDVSLAILERVVADPTASPELKKEVPFRRAAAMVVLSRTEADSKKRAAYLDEAQASIDAFLASGGVSDRQAISAYTQKANLLIERGRAKADQANRPGADPAPLRADAVKFFDEAIKSLQGVAKPGQEIKEVKNAEDAVLKVLREVNEKVRELEQAAAAAQAGGPGPNSARATAAKTSTAKAAAAQAAAAEANAAQAFAAQAAQASQATAKAAGPKPSPAAAKAVAAAVKAAAEAAKTAAMKVATAQAAAAEAAEAKKAAVQAVAAAKADDAGKAKPARASAKPQKELERLTADQEALQGKLIQTRLMTAATYFEKAKAYPAKSKEWTDTLTKSAALFKEAAEKYSNKGGGLFARYYEGRNYALLGQYPLAVETLVDLATIEDKIPLAILIRSRSLNTMLECLIALKKYDEFDESARKFALEDIRRLPGAQLDADWLGLKYRAAVILVARGDQLDQKDPKSNADRKKLLSDAKKLATEVAKANLDFSAEARELAAKLGKEVEEGPRTFAIVMDDAKLLLTTMQERNAELKKAIADKDEAKAAAAKEAATAARTETVAKLEEAMKLAGIANPLAADVSSDDALEGASKDEINQARYLLTFLLYESQRFEESAALARLLVDRYPNAKGSRQAATIGLSAWQQVAQRAEGAARDEARVKAAELATTIIQIWPDEDVSGAATTVLIGMAVAARDPVAIAKVMDQVPATSSKRGEVLLRAGAALWREVQEIRRVKDSPTRPDDKVIEAWKSRARTALDEGLAGVASGGSLPAGPLGALTVAGALSRVQIAMDDDDTAKALAILEQPVYGPWVLVTAKNPVLQQGSLPEASLTLALRLFIQAEKFDLAQQAMDGLEQLAGTGEEASTKLTSMYLSMGRDLQSQLEQLGAGKAKDPQVRAKAERILGGFEKFLDRVASRDTKISSQFWVATTYLTLGSGKGTGAVVPKDKADRYLKRSAEVYGNLLSKKDDPEVARFEPSIRLRMANIYQELKQWDEAQEQLDWFLADAKRQNSLDTQIQAAELLEAAAVDAAMNGDSEKANKLYREASGGRRGKPVVIWGWNDIANKVGRQGIEGVDERSRQARSTFFNARYRSFATLLARARLPGKEAEKKSSLDKADAAITMTHNLYPDLGGPEMLAKFDALLKQVQQEKGVANPQGLPAAKAPAPEEEGK
mgnify:CR=1 FL=1